MFQVYYLIIIGSLAIFAVINMVNNFEFIKLYSSGYHNSTQNDDLFAELNLLDNIGKNQMYLTNIFDFFSNKNISYFRK